MFCVPGIILGGKDGVGSRFHVLRSRTHLGLYRGRRAPFSCCALPDSFWVVPRAPGLVVMFCIPEIVWGGTQGVASSFHVLRSRTRFLRYRGRRVSFACFALPDSFSAVPRAPGPVFMFFAHELVMGGTEGAGSHFSCFALPNSRYRGCQDSFSRFALPGLISTIPVFDGTEGAGSHLMFCTL
jgi:hypothetical protein